jgi:Bacterial membrane protein YfhO
MAAIDAATPARSATRRGVPRLAHTPRQRELVAIAAVMVVAVVVLAPLTLLWEIPRGYDTDAFYAPFGAFLHAQLSQGNLPLWNPHAFAGQPFAADPQSGALYPPALIAYGFLDAPHALVALTTFHFLIAVLGAYAVARLVGANRVGSIYAGLAYGVSGQLFARVQALGLLSGAAWIPVCIAASLLVARRRALLGPELALLAGALCGLALTGSQQITVVTGAACVLVLIVERGARGGVIGLVAGAGAGALAAVALLPRLEFVRLSVSADGVVDPSGVGHLVLSDVRTLFGPFGSRLSEIATVYAGAFTPALALIALVRQPGARRVPIALASFGLVWASGLAGLVLGPVPLIRGVAAHESVRALPLVVLARAVLAGLSISSIDRRPSVKLVSGLTVLLALICAPGELQHEKLPVAIVVMTIVFAVSSRRGVPVVVGGMLLIGALAGDLAWHDYTQRNTRQLAADWQPASRAFPAAPATARFLLARRAAEGPSRFVWLTDKQTRVHQLRYGRAEPEQELLLNMAATRYGLDDVSGYDPVHLKSFSAYLRRSNQYVGLDRHFEWVRVPETPKLDRLGVRYYIAQPGQQPAGLPVVFRSTHAVIVEDPDALPLARLNLATGRILGARIIVRQPDRVVIDTPAASSGRLVLADPAYPGWKVTVDGHGAKSLVTRGIFRAVDLPAGAHRVVWTFEPPRLRIGAIISVVALFALLGVAALPSTRRRWRARSSRDAV